MRWASEDPNPKAIEMHKRKNTEAVDAALAAQGYSIAELEYEYPIDYVMPPAKVLRSDDGAALAPAAVAYPDTDAQVRETPPFLVLPLPFCQRLRHLLALRAVSHRQRHFIRRKQQRSGQQRDRTVDSG